MTDDSKTTWIGTLVCDSCDYVQAGAFVEIPKEVEPPFINCVCPQCGHHTATLEDPT